MLHISQIVYVPLPMLESGGIGAQWYRIKRQIDSFHIYTLRFVYKTYTYIITIETLRQGKQLL